MIRSAGVLLPIFSLPGPFGTGVFGPEALDFARQLQSAGMHRWLVLPFSPPGYGESPYQALSSFAGNPAFIDLRPLYHSGLLSKEELHESFAPFDSTIDYERAKAAKTKALHLAFSRLRSVDHQHLEQFLAQHKDWLDDYSIFRWAKTLHGEKPWWEWEDLKLGAKDEEALAAFRVKEALGIRFVVFEQFLFLQQWTRLKEKINALGVQIIGDLPIYPAADSADLWGQRHLFETDAHGRILRVAGVPPDYFSENGQRWGNPLYRWDLMKDNGYRYWCKRIGRNLEWYDLLRLDHFRGFESYWAIPAEEETAVHGVWEKGPAMDLFRVILQQFPGSAIVAEDLGDITADVRQFLQETGLPGMKVLQFAFDPAFDSKDRPHSFTPHLLAFTGTHDNDTSLGWARSLSEEAYAVVSDYFALPEDALLKSGPQNALSQAMVRCLLQSVAHLVIVPVQDLLGQGSEARINTPGTRAGNWEIRFSQEQLAQVDWAYWGRQNLLAQRSQGL